MVQMKGIKQFTLSPIITLYIPHGSDESSDYQRQKTFSQVLYIPHGSDERKTK